VAVSANLHTAVCLVRGQARSVPIQIIGGLVLHWRSHSVCARQLALFEAEIGSIIEGQRPECVHVLYFDAAVHKVETYEAGQRVHLNPVGGGGTDFRPCFDWIEEKGVVPRTLVFLTDMYGSFPRDAPAYPVLWASTGGRCAPFGEVIPMQSA
jgi:predicted metal-dependent peptidase